MPRDPEARLKKIEKKQKKAQERFQKAEARRRQRADQRSRKGKRPPGAVKKGAMDVAEGLMQTLKALMDYAREQIEHNIRLQMIVTFAVCFMVSMIVFNSTLRNYGRLDDRKYIDYEDATAAAQEKMLGLIDTLGTDLAQASDEELKILINQRMSAFSDTAVYYIVENSGKVLDSNSPSPPPSFDFHSLVYDLQERAVEDMAAGRYTQLISVKGEQNLWLVIEDQLKGVVKYKKAGNLAMIMAVLQSIAVFVLMFYIITKQKISYIQRISSGVGIIARGELAHRVPEVGKDELYQLAKSVNHMSRSLKNQIEAERAAEKSKQELITNVSHDLRTPLTSVLGYLKLVIDKRYDSPEQMEDYLQTVYHKSEMLKALIDDLFDYTKLTYTGIRLERVSISLGELVEQMVEEYIPVLEENHLEIRLEFPTEEAWCMVDPQMLHRVLENLLSNAVKYSDKPGDITVSLRQENRGYCLVMENPAKDLEGVDLSPIFDRFYRLEASRSSDTGGSGLGLGIAKGIIEAHGGTIGVRYTDGRVAFELWLPCGGES